MDELAANGADKYGIVPLESNALGFRYGLLRPGPNDALHRLEYEAAQTELLEPASVLTRRLRQRIGEMVAQQAVEDEEAMLVAKGQGRCHRYNTILMRHTGNKPRAHMKVQELEASISWLERTCLADHAAVLDGDSRYDWTARLRQDWRPPVGRKGGRPGGASRASQVVNGG